MGPMSIWSRISDALSALAAGESLSVVFDRLRSPPERSIAFTIAGNERRIVIGSALAATAFTMHRCLAILA